MNDAPVTKPVPGGAMASEPVITVTTITTLVSAVFAGIVLAMPGIDPQWETIIISVIVAAWPIVTALWARSKAVSPQTAQKDANTAATTGVAPAVMATSKKVPKEKWGVYNRGGGTV